MKKLLALLCLLCAPAFAGNTINIGGLPTPTNGVITLQPGDILPANRTGVTYQLQYPSSIVASSAPAGTLTGTTLAANVVNSSLTSAAGGTFGTGAYATAYVLPTATTSVLGGVKIDGTTITIGTTGIISAAPAAIAIGTTGITGGTSGKLLYDNSAVIGETSALPSGTTATTQAAGDNSTKVATTAFVNGTALTLASGTTATTQSAGDNSTKVATTAYVDGNTVGGANQTWQDVTASRAIGSAYTNSTGRPIQVMITYTSPSGTFTILNLIVGGTTFGKTQAITGTVINNASFIVPAGSTYEISLNNGSNPATIQWSELR